MATDLPPPPGARPDWTIDQGWATYTQAEHDVWITLYERQRDLLPGRACDPFLGPRRAGPAPYRDPGVRPDQRGAGAADRLDGGGGPRAGPRRRLLRPPGQPPAPRRQLP